MNLTIAKWAFGAGVVAGVAVMTKGPELVQKVLPKKKPKEPEGK